MVKGWGGHKEGTKFKSHWGQNIEKKEKKITYKKEEGIMFYSYYYYYYY